MTQDDRHIGEEPREDCPASMYRPDTPWLKQDTSPRTVPERDADGHPWQITGDGRHVGTNNGSEYCLEWLPVRRERQPDFGPREGLERDRAAEMEAGS